MPLFSQALTTWISNWPHTTATVKDRQHLMPNHFSPVATMAHTMKAGGILLLLCCAIIAGASPAAASEQSAGTGPVRRLLTKGLGILGAFTGGYSDFGRYNGFGYGSYNGWNNYYGRGYGGGYGGYGGYNRGYGGRYGGGGYYNRRSGYDWGK